MRKGRFVILALFIFGLICASTVMVYAVNEPEDLPSLPYNVEIDSYYVERNEKTVTKDDVLMVCVQYENNNISSIQGAWEYLYDRAEGREDVAGEIKVVNEKGDVEFICAKIRPGSSGILQELLLISPLTGDEISVENNQKEVEAYFESNRKIRDNVERLYEYVKDNLSKDEYGGIFFNQEDGKVHVMLGNEDRRELLESSGVICEKSDVSTAEQYEKIQELWGQKEELGINYVEINNKHNCLFIYGMAEAEEFKEILTEEKYKDDIYQQRYYGVGGGLKFAEADCDIENFEDFVEIALETYTDYGKQDKEIFQNGLKILKDTYQNYSYRNLSSFLYWDLDYGKCYSFETELQEFVKKLGYIPNKENPFDEKLYGDPEQIALKMLLAEYKKLYPNQDYDKLYTKYVKDIAEDTSMSQREKRAKFFWKRMQAEEQIEEQIEKKPEEDTMPIAIAGCVALIVGGGMMMFMTRKKKLKRNITC